MKPLIHTVTRALFRAGGLGLLTLGTADSSPLVVPLGNDLLMLALSARHHDRVVYYVLMATLGSLIGCLLTDWLSRKGEKGLKKYIPPKHFEFIQQWVKEHAAASLIVASLMPPPFPFTAFVAAAAAFRYPRGKLFGFIAVGRLARFAIEAALAVHYGRWIIRQAESPLFDHVMIAIVVMSIGATAFSVYRWMEENKRPAQRAA